MSDYLRFGLWLVITVSFGWIIGLTISQPELLQSMLLNLRHVLATAGHKFAQNFDPCISFTLFVVILFANKMAGGSLTS